MFSAIKYNQEISELSWLYYLIVGVLEKNQINLSEIFDEEKAIIDNGKKFEYSFLLNNPRCIAAFEVKTITCDPFIKEGLEIIDGKKLVKPFFPAIKRLRLFKKSNRELYLEIEYILLSSGTKYKENSSKVSRY